MCVQKRVILSHTNKESVFKIEFIHCYLGSLLCVKKLLKNGADPNIRDNFNKRPVDYSKENGDEF